MSSFQHNLCRYAYFGHLGITQSHQKNKWRVQRKIVNNILKSVLTCLMCPKSNKKKNIWRYCVIIIIMKCEQVPILSSQHFEISPCGSYCLLRQFLKIMLDKYTCPLVCGKPPSAIRFFLAHSPWLLTPGIWGREDRASRWWCGPKLCRCREWGSEQKAVSWAERGQE